MKNITTLEATKYRGSQIYIRTFENIFEYLVVANGQLYTTHIEVHKRPLQALFGRPYTKKQLEDTTKFLMNTAQATVDYLLEAKK